jgi:hypothetical protein
MSEIKRNAAEARMLLGHPMLNQALDQIKADTVTVIEEMAMTDGVLRDKLMLTLQVCRQFKENLFRHIEEAQMPINDSEET